MKNAVALVAGALGIAGAVAIDAASPSQAAPAIPNTAAVKTTASTQVTDVYYRRGYYGRGYYGRRYYRRGYAYPYGAGAITPIPMGAMPIPIVILMPILTPILPLCLSWVSASVGN